MKVLYFAWMREKIGRSADDFEALPDGVSTVGGLVDHLAGLGGGYAEAFADRNVLRAAVNQSHVGLDHAVGVGDEVAFFPPVTGG